MKPNNKKKSMPIVFQVLGIAFVALAMLCIVTVTFYVGLLEPIKEAEHYLQVYQNTVTVTATVTEHESYDDDGDRDYRSYISYDYNGVHYDNIRYENCGDREDLTAVGTVVNVQVSPKDPSQRIDHLKNNSKMLSFGLFMPALVLAFAYHSLLKSRLSKALCGTPDAHTVQRDLKIMILGRFLGALLFLCVLG